MSCLTLPFTINVTVFFFLFSFFFNILFLFWAILHQIDEHSRTFSTRIHFFFVRFCHFLLVETIRDNVYSSVHRARALDLLAIDFFC